MKNQTLKLNYHQAPLPFQGQKRKFVKLFAERIKQLPEDTIFVDLFGGSGLLSRAAKDTKPTCRVIYNDYDDYHLRIANIANTNKLIAEIRGITGSMPRFQRLSSDLKEKILTVITRHEREVGYVDYITISSSIMFSSKYVLSLEGLRKESFYNSVKKQDYDRASDYLDGLEICKRDYMQLFDEFKHNDKVFFICDPPYLSTDVTTYKMNWTLRDYLRVLNCLRASQFAFFTSEKSSLIELLEWLEDKFSYNNPLNKAKEYRIRTTVNGTAGYEDIMLLKIR
ncbi:MAG: DNA adenine methylase [Porphyromonadaceae bacterium]|nr:DNA adenine methylase [Porphyromonadaceae bacterium]